MFIIFVPLGIFYVFKKIEFKKLTLILWGFGISIPAFYAYSIPLLDTRYLFMLYPIFCVISLFSIQKFSEFFKKQNFILFLIILIVVVSSALFLELKPIDNYQKLEAYQISKEIREKPIVMNSLHPEDRYLPVSILPEKWSNFKELFTAERIHGKSIHSIVIDSFMTVPTEDYLTIKNFIDENPELTHIYIDQKSERPEFLKHIFENEDKYDYLVKIFDSKDMGYDYHIKLFRIDK